MTLFGQAAPADQVFNELCGSISEANPILRRSSGCERLREYSLLAPRRGFIGQPALPQRSRDTTSASRGSRHPVGLQLRQRLS